MNTLWTTASAVALAAMLGSQARAADSAAAASGAPATPTAAAVLPEVIVTAARRQQSLQKTAIPVSVISGDQLERQGVLQPEDLDKMAPGLALSANGANTQVYLRGIGTFSITAFADSAVAFNVDQVFMAFPAEVSGAFYDLQRVEVLKGPQGTLYGRNATAGAINVISNRPSLNGFGGDMSLEVGNYDLVRLSGAANLPVNDNIAVRAAFQVVNRGGYFTDGSGDDKSESARLQALYKPNAQFSLLLATDYTHVHGRGDPNVPLGSAATSYPWEGPSTAQANTQIALADEYGSGRGRAIGAYGPGVKLPLITNDSHVESNLVGVHAEANWDFGFAALTVIPAYRHTLESSIVEPGFFFFGDGDSSQTSLEIRLASPTAQTLKWMVGAYGLGTDIAATTSVYQGVSAQAQKIDQADRSYALFGEATYSLTSKLRLTAGVRYTDETKTQTGLSTITQYVVPQGPYLPPAPLPPFAQTFSYSTPGRLDESNVSGRISAEYDLTRVNLLYATVSTGFKSGGFNADTAPNTYKPEELTAYTLGSKNRFFDGKLQANLELFYWDYHNHQENILGSLNADPQIFAPNTRNIGQSTIKGGNVELQYLPTNSDLLTAQIEGLNAVFNKFVYNIASQEAPVAGIQTGCVVTTPSPTAGSGQTEVNCSGKPFTRAPDWTAVLAYQHTFRLADGAEIIAGVDTKITSSYYIATDYIADELQKAAATTNLNISYRTPDHRWTLTGYVRNVSDQAIATGGFEHPYIPGLVYGTISAPRTFGVDLQTKF